MPSEGSRPENESRHVESSEWRKEFFGKVLSVEGFDRFVDHTLNRTAPSADLVSALKASAHAVCGNYSWDELRAARHFYNTRQLIAFWKHYIGLIDYFGRKRDSQHSQRFASVRYGHPGRAARRHSCTAPCRGAAAVSGIANDQPGMPVRPQQRAEHRCPGGSLRLLRSALRPSLGTGLGVRLSVRSIA